MISYADSFLTSLFSSFFSWPANANDKGFSFAFKVSYSLFYSISLFVDDFSDFESTFYSSSLAPNTIFLETPSWSAFLMTNLLLACFFDSWLLISWFSFSKLSGDFFFGSKLTKPEELDFYDCKSFCFDYGLSPWSLSSFFLKRSIWFESANFFKSINLSATVCCCYGLSSLDWGAFGTSLASNELIAWGAIRWALIALAWGGEMKVVA